MRRLASFGLLGLCLLVALELWAKPYTLNVTIGASATPVIANGNVYCKAVVFQNNTASDTEWIGDANVSSSGNGQGIKLTAGASYYEGPWPSPSTVNLAGWYVAGTQNDVLNVTCDNGQ